MPPLISSSSEEELPPLVGSNLESDDEIPPLISSGSESDEDISSLSLESDDEIPPLVSSQSDSELPPLISSGSESDNETISLANSRPCRRAFSLSEPESDPEILALYANSRSHDEVPPLIYSGSESDDEIPPLVESNSEYETNGRLDRSFGIYDSEDTGESEDKSDTEPPMLVCSDDYSF